MAAEGGGKLDFSNMLPCPCHEWPCNWNEIDRFHLEYRSECRRRFSFHKSELDTKWPHDNLDSWIMARAGFFYTGISDLVRCFECCILIGDWNHFGIKVPPMEVHRNKSSRCRYVLGLRCGNLPNNKRKKNDIDPMLRSHNDVIAMYGDVMQTNRSFPSLNNVSDSMDHFDSTNLGVVNDIRTARYPRYACYGDRLRSFNAWPVTKVQTKEAMSYAGFYYTGKNDKTQCYHCGLELRDWQPEDDPILQHIKMFSKCVHIIKVVEKLISTKAARM